VLSASHPHIIVLGNEKGGTGKSTLAMHIIVYLLELGKKIAVIDIDSRQKSITRYLENRHHFLLQNPLELKMPEYVTISQSDKHDAREKLAEEQESLQKQLDRFNEMDFIVLDCPGNDTRLSRLAHALADTLVTPLNDSYVDLDLLGQVDADTYDVKVISHYSELVWEIRKQRAVAGKPPMDWVVIRNRMATISSYNKQRIDKTLTSLQNRIAFRYIPGLHDRVVYRELFPKGLTFLDLKKIDDKMKTRMSHVATRYEIRQMIENLHLPE
jgi:chromosome partitioning protein